jgi:hypothetical protein
MKMKEFFSAARIMGAAALTTGIVLAASVALTPSCNKDEDKKADDNNTSTTSDAVKRAADSTACLAYSHADTTAAWTSDTGMCVKTPKNSSSNGGFTEIKATGIISYGDIDIDKVKLVWESRNANSSDEGITIATADYSNGSFTMTLPATLPSSVTLLSDGEFRFYGYQGSTRKAILSKFQDDNYEQGIAEVEVRLFYADTACTMKNEEINGNDTIQYDMDIKKGWNWIYAYEGTTTITVTTYPPTSGYTEVWSMWETN